MKKGVKQLIPAIKKNVTWEKNDDGIIIATIWHNNWLEKILQKIIGFPEKFDVDLDEFGSFVWENIDGKKNIFELVNIAQEKFGNEKEQVYKRALIFFKQLLNNKLINFIKEDQKSKKHRTQKNNY